MSRDKKIRKTENKSRMPRIYLIYLGILVFAMLILLMYARKSLILYEYSQPDRILESISASLSRNGITNFVIAEKSTDGEDKISYEIPVTVSVSCNDYEEVKDYVTELGSRLAGSEITYYKTTEDFSSGKVTYSAYIDDSRFADIVLRPNGSRTRLKFLTIVDWSPESMTIYRDADTYDIEITMPENCTASVNGKEIGSDLITTSEPVEALSYCSEYTEIPDVVTVALYGFYDPAEVVVTDDSGNVLDISETCDEATGDMEYKCDFPSPEMPSDLKEQVLEMAEKYSLFFTRDLPGATASIDPIRDLFPEGSDYLVLAETYRRQDMEIIVAHTGTEFTDEEVTDYTVYTDKCFSCRIAFTKTMQMGNKTVTDNTDSVYYFVNIDGEWKIADIE